MKSFRAGIAGLTLSMLFFAAAVMAQEGTPSATPKPVAPAAAAKAGPAGKAILGEIVDPGCYLVNGARGEGHKECALACARAGQTLAILEKKTNKLFILATERPGEDPNRPLLDFIGQTVLVKGRIYTRGGVSGIMVASVEPAGARAAN